MITSPWFNRAAAPFMRVGNSLDYDVSTLSTASVCQFRSSLLLHYGMVRGAGPSATRLRLSS
jgi:hypothetical protein